MLFFPKRDSMMKSTKGRKMPWTPKKIKEFREEIGVSQRVFGLLIDRTMFTVRNWEQGQAVPGRLAVRDLDELFEEWQAGNVPKMLEELDEREKQPA